MWYIGYNSGQFVAVFELYDAYGIWCYMLELLGGDMYDCVCEQFAFGRDWNPSEFLAIAFIA
jgi:hypothetical protein